MKLTRRHLEPGAAVNYIQVSHRRTAIEYALAGIQRLRDANVELLGGDNLSREMEATMQSWVTETLLQGAYLREYHLWEKDCKSYFTNMAKRNNEFLSMKPKRGQRFPELVRDVLAAFAATIPDKLLEEIERMRDRVNIMKHETGLTIDHFIDEGDYTLALAALEEFWATLANFEEVNYGR
ncbi:hypothetical protein AB7M49_002364 [Bradyrhizobium elkanii]